MTGAGGGRIGWWGDGSRGVNYYERYLGDYQRDTGDLSMIEHGAYGQLLDHYYATEMPLPAEKARLYRVCRAILPDEQAAVDMVVDRFFPIGSDGFRHNWRADEEIDKARRRIEAARNNGKGGGRKPKKNPPGSDPDNPTGIPPGSPPGNPGEAQWGDSPHATRHTPHVEEESYDDDSALSKQRRDVRVPVVDVDARQARAIGIAKLLRDRQIALNASNPDVLSWAEEGFTDREILTAMQAAIDNRTAARSMQPINSRYLDAILRRNDAPAGDAPTRDFTAHIAALKQQETAHGG